MKQLQPKAAQPQHTETQPSSTRSNVSSPAVPKAAPVSSTPEAEGQAASSDEGPAEVTVLVRVRREPTKAPLRFTVSVDG